MQIELINKDGRKNLAMISKGKLYIRNENCNGGVIIELTEANRQKIRELVK